MSAQADYLLEWLDSLALSQKPVVVGHDLGGGVAQIAAVRRPQAFAGLLLTNSVSYDSWPIPSVKLMQKLAGALAPEHHPDPRHGAIDLRVVCPTVRNRHILSQRVDLCLYSLSRRP